MVNIVFTFLQFGIFLRSLCLQKFMIRLQPGSSRENIYTFSLFTSCVEPLSKEDSFVLLWMMFMLVVPKVVLPFVTSVLSPKIDLLSSIWSSIFYVMVHTIRLKLSVLFSARRFPKGETRLTWVESFLNGFSHLIFVTPLDPYANAFQLTSILFYLQGLFYKLLVL